MGAGGSPGLDATALARLASLDLGFLELDVLARLRVIFAEAQLFRLSARILLGHVKEARVRGADELDLDRCRLRHWMSPNLKKEKRHSAAQSWGQMTQRAHSVNRRAIVTAP